MAEVAEQADSSGSDSEMELALVYGRLDAFVDFGPRSDVRLSCFSQMSSHLMFCPSVGKCPKILNLARFIQSNCCVPKNDFLLEPCTRMMVVLHGPSGPRSIEEALECGDISMFLGEYDIVAFLLWRHVGGEIKVTVSGEWTNPHFTGCGSITYFLRAMARGCMCWNPEGKYLGTSPSKSRTVPRKLLLAPFNEEVIQPHEIPAIESLCDFIKRRAGFSFPRAAGASNSRRLKEFRKSLEKSITTRNILEHCPNPRAASSMCISVGKILDNQIEFGPKELGGHKLDAYKKRSVSLERILVSSVVVYKCSDSEFFRLGCKCCGEDVHNDKGGNYGSVHEALEDAYYSAVYHRLVTMLKDPCLKQVYDSSRIEEYPTIREYPYQIRPHHISLPGNYSHVKTCRRDFSTHDSCLGDDQLILSSIYSECADYDEAGAFQNKAYLFGDLVRSSLLEGKKEHDDLEDIFIEVLGDEEKINLHFHTAVDSSLTLQENDGSWKSTGTHELQTVLVTYLNSVMKVDWRDDSFPTHIPDDLELPQHKDRDILRGILESRSNKFKFLHQLGILPSYLHHAPHTSSVAAMYRALPTVAIPYAFECANKCKNIFTQEGRTSIVPSSVVFVMKSIVPSGNLTNEIKMAIHRDGTTTSITDDGHNNYIVEWIADNSMIGCKDSRISEKNGCDSLLAQLKHGTWVGIDQGVSRSIQRSVRSEVDGYSPRSFSVVSLNPFISRMVSTSDEGKVEHRSTIGLAKLQNAVSIAFFHGTVPHQKAMEKVTNVCFQEGSSEDGFSLKLRTREKHSQSEEVDNVKVFDETSQVRDVRKRRHTTQSNSLGVDNGRGDGTTQVLDRRKRRRKSQVNSSYPIVSVQNIGCNTTKGHRMPASIQASLELPIRVELSKWNCAIGNACNLLASIGQLDESVNDKLLASAHLRESKTMLPRLEQAIRSAGYNVIRLPTNLNFEQLSKHVRMLSLPALVSLRLDYAGVDYQHVVGICPFKSGRPCHSSTQYRIVDGAHPDLRPIDFSISNLDWCCGKASFTSTVEGFVFFPGSRRGRMILDNLKTTYEQIAKQDVPYTSVCFGIEKSHIMPQYVKNLNVVERTVDGYKQLMGEMLATGNSK